MELEAGVLLVKAARLAAREGLTGLEFASGIPGTLGGALVMNAGAYGGEMKDVVREALVMRKDGKLLRLKREELELGYRTSVIARGGLRGAERASGASKGRSGRNRDPYAGASDGKDGEAAAGIPQRWKYL